MQWLPLWTAACTAACGQCSLHSTFAKPRHRTLGTTQPLSQSSPPHCPSTLHPATLHSTLRHHALASSLHSTLRSTFARPRHRSGQQPAQHSTMPKFVPPAAPLKISVHSSLAQPAACCTAFARPRQPAARCTARFPDFATAANSSQPQPVQHLGQHSTSARLRHRTVSSSLTAGLHSTLHSTFARPRHRSLNTSLHTTMRRTTAQHLCQTLPPHSQHPQQPAQHHAQHPAQHLCQTSPQSPPPKTSPLRSKNPQSFQLSGEI